MKKFNLKIVGEDGNAFVILGKFQRGAKKAGWKQDEIKQVTDEATSGDYDKLLRTMMKYTNVR